MAAAITRLGLRPLGAVPLMMVVALTAACSADPPAASVSRVPSPSGTQPSSNPSSSGPGTAPNQPTTMGPGNPSNTTPPTTHPNNGVHDAGQTATPSKDAGPALPVMCVAVEDGGADEDGGATRSGCLVVSDLHLQYRAADTNAGDNQIKPHFNIVNHGTLPIDLSELTIRYWYSDTAEPADMAFACDYAQIGCGSVRNAFASDSGKQHANRHLELSLSSGSLAAGAQTGEIQARFNRTDWTNFDESDDYSFDPTKTAFADWFKVTLYRRGTLVWGAEPD